MKNLKLLFFDSSNGLLNSCAFLKKNTQTIIKRNLEVKEAILNANRNNLKSVKSDNLLKAPI